MQFGEKDNRQPLAIPQSSSVVAVIRKIVRQQCITSMVTVTREITNIDRLGEGDGQTRSQKTTMQLINNDDNHSRARKTRINLGGGGGYA